MLPKGELILNAKTLNLLDSNSKLDIQCGNILETFAKSIYLVIFSDENYNIIETQKIILQ